MTKQQSWRVQELMRKTKSGTEEGNIMELELLLGQSNLTPKEKNRVASLMKKVSPLDKARAELQRLLSKPESLGQGGCNRQEWTRHSDSA